MRTIPAVFAASGIAALLVVSVVAPASGSAVGVQARTANLGSVVHSVRTGSSSARLDADSQSNNWSGYGLGYLSTGTLYSSISGTWVVPTAKQKTKGQAEYGATWIGIGGGCYNTSCIGSDETLIQAGTEQDVSKKGKASYSAWYELIPETSTTESIKVNPGDVIHCSIVETSSGEWTIKLTDKTDKQHFTESTAYPSDESTAEWIVETPVVVSGTGTGVANLPNLGNVKFTNAQVNGGPAGLVAADAIQLVDSNSQPIATPSKPTAAGTAFIDCTYASTCKS
jgi:Peptidase A4 family